MDKYSRSIVSLVVAIAFAPGCGVWYPQIGAPPRAAVLRPPVAGSAMLPPEYLAGLAGGTGRPLDKGVLNSPANLPGPPPAGAEQRVGSVISPASQTATVPAGVDPKAFNEVIAQLESIGAIDPAKQARLMEDLKQTDPSLWPLMLEAFRASLAYHERIAAKTSGGAADPVVAGAGQLAKNGNDPRAGSAQGQSSPAAVRPATDLSPWSALNVPPDGAAKNATENVRAVPPILAKQAGPTTGSKVAADAPANAEAAAVAAQPVSPIGQLAGQPHGNHSPSVEPGKFPAVDSQRVAASPGASADVQRAGGVAPVGGAIPFAAASTLTSASDPESAVARAPSAPVQQASYQPKLDADDFEGHLTAAIRALETKTKKPPEGPDGIAAHAYLRMLYLAAGRREDALRPIAGISPAEQDYWTKQLWGLATYLDNERSSDAPRRAAEAAQHLNEAAGKLGEMATLVVRNLAFCTEVRSYGVFTRFKDYEFTPGQRLLLYAEVENFKSDHTRKGYHTALKSSYQILDAQGRRVAGDDSNAMEEYCQNPRRDYFLSYEHLHLPSPMYEGRYTLQLTIEDTLSQKIGQSSIEFTVRAK